MKQVVNGLSETTVCRFCDIDLCFSKYSLSDLAPKFVIYCVNNCDASKKSFQNCAKLQWLSYIYRFNL